MGPQFNQLKKIVLYSLPIILIGFAFASCEKDFKAETPKVNSSFVEGFDVFEELAGRGWVFTNNSAPIGIATWFQGESVFNAQSSNLSPNSYAAVNYNSVSDAGTISNWMFSPAVDMKNGDQIIFYARAASSMFPERLQIRVNPYNEGVSIGTAATSVGDFNVLLRDINPTYVGTGFPVSWTKYIIPISGVSGEGKRRFAFRYFVEDGGPLGANSNYIGVDSVAFISK
jgi:hypothetical protein